MASPDSRRDGPSPWNRIVAFARIYGRWILLVLGVVAVAVLVRESGPERVLAVVFQALPWAPAIFALEVAWISMDAFALRSIYRERGRGIPLSDWVRSSLTAYAVMVLLPAGRAGGEAMRALHLSKHVGMLSATAAAQVQGSTLVANAVISLPCFIAVAGMVGPAHPLSVVIALNGLATLLLGLGAMFVTSRSKLGASLARRFSFMKQYADQLDDAAAPLNAFPKGAVAWTVFGRVLQTLQYGIILLAIGGQLTVTSSLVSQGIHLVGAGLGDMVPNAVGITETAYRLSADVLGFGDEPARAIAIALVARLTQYTLAAIALLAGAALRAPPDDLGKEIEST
ncbi:MAG: hypothetical protein AAFU79_00160 [Myxococcota bacterium]